MTWTEYQKDTIDKAIHYLDLNINSTKEDPVLVIFWNETRLLELSINHPQPKQQILDFFQQCHGQLLDPLAENFVFFKEPSLLTICRGEMKRSLPWAFCVGAETALILNIPEGIPIAHAVSIYKTDKVKPDICPSDFFTLN